MLKCLVEDSFTGEPVATVLMVEGQKVKLQMSNITGQEHLCMIAKAYYRTAVGVIAVCDLTHHKTFESPCDTNSVVQLIPQNVYVRVRKQSATTPGNS
jgi:hypothetical protein